MAAFLSSVPLLRDGRHAVEESLFSSPLTSLPNPPFERSSLRNGIRILLSKRPKCVDVHVIMGHGPKLRRLPRSLRASSARVDPAVCEAFRIRVAAIRPRSFADWRNLDSPLRRIASAPGARFLFSATCALFVALRALFCTAPEAIPRIFMRMRTLAQNHGGWGAHPFAFSSHPAGSQPEVDVRGCHP
jgi:hypothetical protein